MTPLVASADDGKPAAADGMEAPNGGGSHGMEAPDGGSPDPAEVDSDGCPVPGTTSQTVTTVGSRERKSKASKASLKAATKTSGVNIAQMLEAVQQVDDVIAMHRDAQENEELEGRTLRLRARNVVRHRCFEQGIALVIFLNAVYIGIETNFHEEGTSEFDGPWYAIELTFGVIFIGELALRLTAFRLDFFFDGWNVFDFLLVALASVDTFILSFVDSGNSALDIVSLLRILRIARVARIFRLLRFFTELWLLVLGVFDAMRTLVWAWMLITMLIYVSAIFITRLIGQAAVDNDDLDVEVQESIHNYFGKVHRTMFTLFQVMTTEGWVDITRESMLVQPWSVIFFVLYLMTTTFAIMNVVVAVIVEKTLERALQSREDRLKMAQEDNKKANACVREIFKTADLDQNKVLTKKELLVALERPHVMKMLHDIDVDVRQAEHLFDVLDFDESGWLDQNEFTEGVLNVRGQARSKDVLAIQCELWRTEETMRWEFSAIKEETERSMTAVSKDMARMKADVETITQLALKTAEQDASVGFWVRAETEI